MDTNMYNFDNRYGKSLTAGPGQLSSLFASLCGEVIRYQFGQLQSELAWPDPRQQITNLLLTECSTNV